ncbi:MAG: Tail-specific protease [Chlamydiae bacterium]|nr:Tail-specific protease [Chlamydiota bacterium]
MKIRCFVLACLFLFSPLIAKEALLSPSDVRPVMEQFFILHVDKKEMNSEILGRGLTLYLNQFDPSYSYLTSEEAHPFLKPDPYLKSVMQEEYTQDRFSAFFALNETIQNGINRARNWRAEWGQNPEALVTVAKSRKTEEDIPKKSYPTTEEELKQRHYDRYARFIAFQMEMLGEGKTEGKEVSLITLCEKQLQQMENGYLGVGEQGEELSTEKEEHLVVMRTLKALAASLDAHTAYYSPEEALALKAQLEKGMSGVGVLLREGMEGITIFELVEGGPAAESGELQKGDLLVDVDGTQLKGLSFQKVLEVMRGKEGSKTKLGIVRTSSKGEEYKQVELTRSRITLDEKRVDVSSEPYGDGVIGKITLYSFYEGEGGINSEADIKAAIDELRKEGPLYGLVLDIRDNGGGFLTQAVKVSGLFISSGVVVISKYSDGQIKYYRAVDGSRYYDGPLVILTDRGSASASEIVAQTLQDYGVAIVVGDEQTYGKGTIQHQTVTHNKAQSFFKVTVGRYYTASGRSTQLEGVKSDIVVPSPLQFEEVGEAFLEFPLQPDEVAPAFADNLQDLDPFVRKWFQKYYIPTIQEPTAYWSKHLPSLQERSQNRLAQNQEFQEFLKSLKTKDKSSQKLPKKDLQMEESVLIVRDMIEFSQK